jgi:hypothetical protein
VGGDDDNSGEDVADMLRAWLRRIITRSGLKPTPFAEACGLAPSTVIRALDENNPGHLSWRTIDRIVRRFGVSPPTAADPLAEATEGFAEDVAPFQTAPPPELRPTHADQSVWTVRGRSLDLAGYVPGDLILLDRGVRPRPGDAVCAQVIDHMRGGAESVFRVWDPPYLITETGDSTARRKPLLVDDDRVAIVGTVVRALRLRALEHNGGEAARPELPPAAVEPDDDGDDQRGRQQNAAARR